MRTMAKRSAILALALAAAPSPVWANEEEDPEQALECERAFDLQMADSRAESAKEYLRCADVPGQTPFMIAKSRVERLRMFEEEDKADLAEAELAALTSPPIANFRVFTNVATGYVAVGGQRSVGYTQPDLLTARAIYRLNAKDLPAARDLARRAIALADYDAAYVFDVGPAFALLARLAAIDNQPEAMLRLTICAYLRGVDDDWTRPIITTQDAQTQAQLLQLRKHLQDRVGGYAFAISPQGRKIETGEQLAKAITDAKETMAALKSFEAEQLGPL